MQCSMQCLLFLASSALSFTRTGWRRPIGSPESQIIFHKRAIKYRSLLREMTCKDKGSYESSPRCTVAFSLAPSFYFPLAVPFPPPLPPSPTFSCSCLFSLILSPSSARAACVNSRVDALTHLRYVVVSCSVLQCVAT